MACMRCRNIRLRESLENRNKKFSKRRLYYARISNIIGVFYHRHYQLHRCGDLPSWLESVPHFFGDIAAMTWPGQFNFDFSCFLILSGLWLSWRHHFSLGGLVLGVLGIFGGIMFLASYLLIASVSADGDMKTIFLGKIRARR
jgi:hypothetical protein